MPRNASGTYTLPSGNPVVPGTTIDATWANNTLDDIANELTNSLSRTGAGGMIAPFRVADGAASAPGLAFTNETNSGLYRSGAGSAWMSILGVNVAQFSGTGLTIPSSKALAAQGNATVGGTLGVTGATTLSSTLAVTGAITATGGVLGNVTGNLTGNVTGNVSGNAGTVTNGVYTTGSYSDPAWITALAGSKVTGNIAGNASNVTGTVAIANGGTGQTTANAGLNALLPAQAAQSGKYLKTDGTNASWDQLDISTADITGTLPIANGGTNSTTAAGARSALGLAIGTDIPSPTGTGASGTWGINVSGNAGTVTNGLYSTGSYADPAWLTSLSASKLTGTVAVATGGTGASTASGARANLGLVIGTDVPSPTGTGASGTWGISVSGNAATVTNGVYTTGSYADPAWITSLAGTKISGNISGNAANVTGTVAVANGGTGLTSTPTNGQLDIGNGTGFTRSTLTAGSGISITNGAGSITISATGGGTGTVTSVNASGGTTGLSFTGGPITSSGTLTLGGTLAVANGGTGATTSAGALTSLGALPTAGGTMTGNLAFSGTGLRITGDFSNATPANRVLVQSSTTDGNTLFGVLPNGTAVNSQLQVWGASDPTNAPFGTLTINATAVQLQSTAAGIGTALPLRFMVSATEAARFDTSARMLVGFTTNQSGDKLQVSGTVWSNAGFTSYGTAGSVFTANANGVGTISAIFQNTGGNLYVGRDSSTGSTFGVADAHVLWGSGASNSMVFGVASAERFRFGPAGQLGIGGANYGTAGQVLTSGGAGAAPTWSTASGISTGKAIAMAIVFGG